VEPRGGRVTDADLMAHFTPNGRQFSERVWAAPVPYHHWPRAWWI